MTNTKNNNHTHIVRAQTNKWFLGVFSTLVSIASLVTDVLLIEEMLFTDPNATPGEPYLITESPFW